MQDFVLMLLLWEHVHQSREIPNIRGKKEIKLEDKNEHRKTQTMRFKADLQEKLEVCTT